jgi:23S rRNA pseudouridine2605 synthase
MAKLRLNKILARAGLTSRRGADRLVVEGRVAVNRLVVREPGTLADPDADDIRVDGHPIGAAEGMQYVLLHKPAGYVTSRRDPAGRAVVTDLVPASARLFPVGRLDVDVEGALLLTNDGTLTHRLLHPRYGIPRVYEAEVEGGVTPRELPRWRHGARLDDGLAVPVAVDLVRAGRTTSRVRLTFAEGRKHEVKRYCEALGHRVIRLRRIAFGPITLGNLPVGAARPLTKIELAALRHLITVGESERRVGRAKGAPSPSDFPGPTPLPLRSREGKGPHG